MAETFFSGQRLHLAIHSPLASRLLQPRQLEPFFSPGRGPRLVPSQESQPMAQPFENCAGIGLIFRSGQQHAEPLAIATKQHRLWMNKAMTPSTGSGMGGGSGRWLADCRLRSGW